MRETRRKQDPTRASRRDGPTWAKFPRSRARAILAAGFFTVSVLDGTTVHVLAVTGHATRRIRILGSTACPAGARTTQQARNLLTDPDDAAEKTGFLIRDRDARFTAAFHAVFQSAGIRIITSPVQAPRANAIMERCIGGCRRELLDRTLTWNQQHLLNVPRQYETHHNEHRPHRSIGQAAPLRPLPETVTALDTSRTRRRDLIGGVIHEYAQVA